MKNFTLLFIFIFFVLLFPVFADASSLLYELDAGPQQAFVCGQTVSDSITFSDEPSRFLKWVDAGGNVGADDVAFFYKNGSQILIATHCNGINSPGDIPCNTACAGTTNIVFGNYFTDSGASSPDSVTFSGTAYETYQPTTLTTDVAFDGLQISVFWQDCGSGQRVDNGSCVVINGSITPNKTSCTEPCNVSLDWSTNSYQTATITRNGTTNIATVTTTSGVSNTTTSGGPIVDNGLAAGTYNYCIKGNYPGSPNNQPIAMSGDLDCKTVTVGGSPEPLGHPTADLDCSTNSSSGPWSNSCTVTAPVSGPGPTVWYRWSSTDATSWSSNASAPGICPGEGSWVANSESGSTSGSVTSSQGGCTYTISYTATGPGGSDTDSITVTVNTSSPTPTPSGPTPTPDEDEEPEVQARVYVRQDTGSSYTSGNVTAPAPYLDIDVRGRDIDTDGGGGEWRFRFYCEYPGPISAETFDDDRTDDVEDLCDYPNPGTYTVRVHIREENDAGSDSDSDTLTITVTAPVNDPPSASSITVTEVDYCVSGPAVTVGWTYSDPDDDPQSAYQVQVDDQSSFNSPEIDSGQVPGSGTSYFTGDGIPPWAWNTTYRARVRVWDSQGNVSAWSPASSTWKTPKHAYPAVNFTWSPSQPPAKQPVQFTDQTQFFDSGGPGLQSWNWLFKAPAPSPSSTLQNPNYTYADPGLYNVDLTVTDKDGYTCSLAKPINIDRPIPVWQEVSPK